MLANLARAVGPYLFKGGSPADYLTGVGPAGTFFTMHRASRQVIQSVVPSLGSVVERLPVTQVLGAANNLYNTHLLHKVQSGVQMANVLGAANLGVGLVNLGVGIYNAYQIRQVRKQLEGVDRKLDGLADGQREIKDSLEDLAAFSALAAERVQHTLHDHGILLGLLYHSGEETHVRIDQLRAEMHAGFKDLFAGQLAAEARAVRRELDARQSAAVRHFRAVHAALAAGCEPSARELASVIDSSVELIAWVDAVRRTEVPGAPAHMPLLAVKATGIRMLLDARSLESPQAAIVTQERREFLDEVAADAAALVSDRSLGELALDLHEVLAGHVYLHRAFGIRVDIGFEGQRPVPLVPADHFGWDDLLGELRRAAIGIETEGDGGKRDELPDADWLGEWESEHGTSHLPRGEDVLAALGLRGAANDTSRAGTELTRLAVRSGRAEVARHLQKTFGLERAPRLVAAAPQA